MAGREPGADGREPLLDPAVLDSVSSTPLAVVVLEVPSERITAASPSAAALLAPDGAPVVGRSLEEFAADEPSGALDLLLAGRLNGYETRRVLRRGTEEPLPLQVWIRSVDRDTPPRVVLGVLSPGEGRSETLVPPSPGDQTSLVVGTVDADLLLERISSDVTLLLGYEPSALAGQPILRIVDPPGLSALLWALAQATTSRSAVALSLGVLTNEGRRQQVQLLLMPLEPPPGFAFVLHPSDSGTATPAPSPEGELRAVGRDIEAADVSRGLATLIRPDVPGLSELTSRELDIVGRLITGDRVPAIARTLFLSQSTVRNHLSSAFRKLHVTSQQGLVDLLRRTDGPQPGT